MLKFEKVAMPLTALTVAVPPSVLLPGLLPIEIVTGLVAVVTVLPPASWMVTVTAGVIDVPAAVVEGCTLKASLVTAPAVTLNVVLVAPANAALQAASV